MLRSAAEAPRRRLAEAPRLGADEERTVAAWAVGPELAAPALLPDRIAAAARRWPTRPAVECEGRVLTYAELEAAAARLARCLRERGVGAEARVALCLRRSPAVIAAILGCWKAGAAYVPLDSEHPEHRLRQLLEDCGAAVVITDPESAGRLPDRWRRIVVEGDGSLRAGTGAGPEGEGGPDAEVAPPAARRDGATLAYVLYTSGSTGRPKGVAVEHRQIASYVAAVERALELPAGASWALVSTFAADLGATAVFSALAGGGSLHVIPEAAVADGERLAESLEALGGVDGMKVVPSHLALLMRGAGSRVLPRRRLVLGGEALPAELLAAVRAAAPELVVCNHYGPTETTVGVVATALDGEGSGTVPPPLGRPLPGSRVHLLDAALRPVPIGATGEIWVGGAGVSRGYLGAPALTAERFLPDPLSGQPGARLYRTSDLGRWNEAGRVEFLGRADDQVKIRGFRVEPGEVEAALRRHEAVSEAAVVAREDGGAHRRLVAYVVPAAGRGATAGELRSWLEGRLPAPLVPSGIVVLDRLPLTANGKLDRAALPAPRSEPASHAAPLSDPLEVQLAHLWEEVLGVEDVGRGDNFFDLGGDSFLAVRLMALIRRHLEVRLPLATLIVAADVGELAERVRQEAVAPRAEHRVEIQPRGSRPPLYCVHPGHGSVVCYLELAHRLGRDQPLVGLQALDFDHDRPAVGIGEMAERYVETLVDEHPPGQPYRLAGWSFGGLVAFEMAHRLRELGETVDALFLFDTRLPVTAPTLVALEPARLRASLLFAHLVPPRGEAARVTVDELAGLDLDGQLALAAERLGRPVEALLGREIEPELLTRYLDVRMARVRALAEYRWRPYGGRLTLFRAEAPSPPPALEELGESFARAAATAEYGWRRWAEEVTVIPLPGSHDSLLAEPCVRQLATAIEGVLPPPPAPSPTAITTATRWTGRWSPLNRRLVERAAQRPALGDRSAYAALARDNPLPSMSIQPWPLFVSAERSAEAARVAVGLDRLLRSVFDRFFDRQPARIAAFYRSGGDSGDFYHLDLSEAEAALMLEEPDGLDGAPSRGDYIDTGEGLSLLEFNAGSGLGGWQVEAVEEPVCRHPGIAGFLADAGVGVAAPPVVRRLFRHFARSAAAQGVWEEGDFHLALVVHPHLPEQVAIHSRQRYQRELDAAVEAVRPGRGSRVSLCGFGDLREEGGRLAVDGVPLHALFEQHDGGGDVGLAYRYAKTGRLDLFTGPLSALLSDKRNVALLSEHADSAELDAAERELVARHLPWTRRVVAQRTDFRGRPVRLPDDLVDLRRDMVLKKATSLAGGHVLIGPATPPRPWRDAVARAVEEGDWVVQEYLDSVPYTFLGAAAGTPVVHDVIWGLFVFGGEYGGPFLRAQPRDPASGAAGVVNTHRGAEVVLPLEERLEESR